jgi:predicted alpha/beta-hydrolase family hydrolase
MTGIGMGLGEVEAIVALAAEADGWSVAGDSPLFRACSANLASQGWSVTKLHRMHKRMARKTVVRYF